MHATYLLIMEYSHFHLILFDFLFSFVTNRSPNSFQNYLNTIKKPNINFQELYDKDTLYDADLILQTFASIKPQNNVHDQDYEEDTLPCKWLGNTKCSPIYEPVCVTDLNCIFVVHNKCLLDKMNCGCTSHFVLPSTFCENFTQPLFKRCNIKIFIQ
ncbi:uncharacterized protein LOC119602090 isoform X1 [Lucilia sericata]|uniref:uncharacterized protein LOC119602090 isoform X1 n=1 Tax=Lucilia sericata TaxID=13632 RepID=UPI0018A7FD92|nr:uncharacterized protein LOC119602090 isoform X1 [Lucilia sericata]